MPLAWWTPISKDPFRFLIAMDRSNHSLGLLRDTGEAVLHFMPWESRQRVIRAGYLTGAKVAKSDVLGFTLEPAAKLKNTSRVQGAYSAFELTVVQELESLSGDHVPFVMEVEHVHTDQRPGKAEPILFLGYRGFATLGKQYRFRR
jgi:flavin reductase (DIM6/NTAB) family NADH-FMN oxidoreductase RutF